MLRIFERSILRMIFGPVDDNAIWTARCRSEFIPFTMNQTKADWTR